MNEAVRNRRLNAKENQQSAPVYMYFSTCLHTAEGHVTTLKKLLLMLPFLKVLSWRIISLVDFRVGGATAA